MSNTGRKILTVLEVEVSGVPIAGSPFAIDINAIPEDIVIATGGVVTLEQATSLLNNRYIENSTDCIPACKPLLITDELTIEAVYNDNIGESIHAVVCGVTECITAIESQAAPAPPVNFNRISLYFKDNVTEQIVAVSEQMTVLSIEPSVFSVINTSLLTLEYDATDITFATPDITTTDINLFNSYINGKTGGYIRVSTSQTNFDEGGLYLNFEEATQDANTSVVISQDANLIDRDFVINIPANEPFQLTSLTDSRGDVVTKKVLLGTGDDKTILDESTLDVNTALTNNITQDRQIQVHTRVIDNTLTRTLTVDGTGMTNEIRYIEGSQRDRENRTTLSNNAKIYDGITDYDKATSGNYPTWDIDQAFTFFCVFRLDDYSALIGAQAILSTFWDSTGAANIGTLVYIDTAGHINLSLASQNASQNFNYSGGTPITRYGYNQICITYNGTPNLASSVEIYINGKIDEFATVTSSAFPVGGTILSSGQDFNVGMDNPTPAVSPRWHFGGDMRIMEFADSVKSKADIREAFNTGSLASTTALSEYLLAIDFNKTGSNNLTEVTGTPNFAPTASGGAAYTNFY